MVKTGLILHPEGNDFSESDEDIVVQDIAVPTNGVAIGHLISVKRGRLYVVFPENPKTQAVLAKSTVQMSSDDIGSEVALMFESGDLSKPIVIGKIISATQELRKAERLEATNQNTAQVDGEAVEISGQERVVLRCGKASITLTPEGKIILRGTYISSRSSGMNRIKGGSIQLN